MHKRLLRYISRQCKGKNQVDKIGLTISKFNEINEIGASFYKKKELDAFRKHREAYQAKSKSQA